jgi:PII-like signaling protein
LHEEEIAGVTVLRGIEGYGSGKQIHTTKIEFLSMNLPVVIVAVDHKEKIEAVIPKVKEVAGTEGLMSVEKVEVVSPTPAVVRVR